MRSSSRSAAPHACVMTTYIPEIVECQRKVDKGVVVVSEMIRLVKLVVKSPILGDGRLPLKLASDFRIVRVRVRKDFGQN